MQFEMPQTTNEGNKTLNFEQMAVLQGKREEVQKEIQKTEDLLSTLTGLSEKWFNPISDPGGEQNNREIIKDVKQELGVLSGKLKELDELETKLFF